MKKIFFAFLFLSLPLYAEGPLFTHQDTYDQQEFENIYQNLRHVTGISTFYAAEGLATSPSYSFTTSTTTGFYYSDSGKLLGFAYHGNRRFYYQEGTPPSLNFDSGVQISAADGTVSLPGYGFNSETNSGLYRIGSHDIALGTNGIKALEINSSQQILGVTGTGALPTFASQAHPTSGLAVNSTGGVVILTINGTDVIDVSATKLEPAADNTVGLGESGDKYTSVWAVNGTIQQSTFKRKTAVREITPKGLVAADTATVSIPSVSSPVVPRGIVFKWKEAPDGRDYIGFAADDLPLEAHPLKDDGTYDMENVYTSATIGMLCSAVRDLQARVTALEGKGK